MAHFQRERPRVRGTLTMRIYNVVPDGPCAGACDADSRLALRSVARRTRASGRLLHGFRRLRFQGPASRQARPSKGRISNETRTMFGGIPRPPAVGS